MGLAQSSKIDGKSWGKHYLNVASKVGNFGCQRGRRKLQQTWRRGQREACADPHAKPGYIGGCNPFQGVRYLRISNGREIPRWLCSASWDIYEAWGIWCRYEGNKGHRYISSKKLLVAPGHTTRSK